MVTHALVVAAGSSSRMKGEDKVFADLCGKPIIMHTLEKLAHNVTVQSITIITKEESVPKIQSLIKDYHIKKVKTIIEGGERRQDSVFNGLHSLDASSDDVVLVHNACNPLVTDAEITSCIEKAQEVGAAVVGFPLKDTIKKVDEGKKVESTIDRQSVYQVQTPQCIQYALFLEGFNHIKEKNVDVTDDVSVVEALGKGVAVVACSTRNFKITTKEDLDVARQLVNNKKTVVGVGEDSHRFTDDSAKKLVLGGHRIDSERGFDANSDGDVILHAAYNALSSCLGGRSLSIVADPLCKKGVTDSVEYLIPVLNDLYHKNGELIHLSISIEAKQPKLEQYHDKIKESLCSIFSLKYDQTGLTFTTGEEMSGAGTGEGMYCRVVVTVRK